MQECQWFTALKTKVRGTLKTHRPTTTTCREKGMIFKAPPTAEPQPDTPQHGNHRGSPKQLVLGHGQKTGKPWLEAGTVLGAG